MAKITESSIIIKDYFNNIFIVRKKLKEMNLNFGIL